VSDSSDDRLERLAGRRRHESRTSARRANWQAALLIGLLGFVLLGAAAAWRLASGSIEQAGPLPGLDQLAAWYLGQRAEDLRPVSTVDETEVVFEVREGDLLPVVAERLAAEGIVRSADAFRLLARVRGLDRQIQAGRHTLRRTMSAEEVLQALLVASEEGVTVTVPEGWRAEELATLLAERGLVDRSEFLLLVGQGRAEHAALADRPEGAGLEGYLFPDTYQFEPEAGAVAVIGRMLDTFEARVTPEMHAQATAAGLSLYQVVTLASIVEREAAVPEERARIARVYLNRLAAPPFILNADPTVQYALGYQPEAGTWWKRPLTREDLAVDSAYNSYTQAGLPPGPIASPGLASIQAVLAPEDGRWQYFVANDVACDGTHVFAETLEEHLQNIAAYQTGECGR
jgi:UPF0755 protein